MKRTFSCAITSGFTFKKAVTYLLLVILLLGLSVPQIITTSNPAQAASLPDLVVNSVDDSGVTGNWQTLAISGNISAQIANAGTAAAGPFNTAFFEDTNGNKAYDSGVDKVLGSAASAGLAGGATATVSAPVSGTVVFRDNLIYAFADSGNTVAESNEANNYSNSGLSCQFAPTPGAFAPVLEWSWTSSAIQPTSLNVMMTPGVIDLNGDGIPDVVFASTASTGGGYVEVGILRALSGNNGAELFNVTNPTLAVNTTSSVAVGDIDLDGKPEIIACDSSGSRLIAFENDGTFKWRSPNLESINWGAPSLADLDGDGTPEIIIGRQVLNNNGTVRWTGTGGRGSQNIIGPLSLVADINMDGIPEVVAGNTAYTAAGAILWQNAALPDGYNAIGNFDADAFPEIVLVSGGYVRLLEHTGAVKWGPVAIPGGGNGGPPTVADYDNDGQPEIGVAGASRYAVFETNGTLKWAAITQDGSSNVSGSSVFDFEGDGLAEVVYRDELKLRVYRGTNGGVLFEAPMSSCTWYEYVLVADVDADGNAEIVAVANNNCGYGTQRGIYVYGDASDSWVATRQIWNQHTYHITNVNDNGSIPAHENNNWETFNNYRQNVQTYGSPLAAPDLTASFLRAVWTAAGWTMTARTGNGGSNLVGAGVPVSFYDGDPRAGGTLLGTRNTSIALNPGQYEDVVLTLPPTKTTTGTVWVVADDAGGLVSRNNECNEQNNIHDSGMMLKLNVAELRAKEYRWSQIHTPAYNWSFPRIFNGWQQVRFENKGPNKAFKVKATITWAPPNVTIVDGVVSLGDISAGSSAWSSDDFALSTDMSNPSDPRLKIVWKVEYDDASGVHYVVENIPQ